MDAVDDTEDVALNFGEEDDILQKKRFRHPLAVFFHLVFRVLAIITYLLCGWFSSSFIINFVIIVLLLSMDFWTVKNITGRLLVGLRWWNQIDEDGKSQWIFESRKSKKGPAAERFLSGDESRIFWLSMVICEVLWFLFLLRTLFTFNLKWFMVVCVGIMLNGANLYGYIRCKLGTQKKISTMATNFLGQRVLRSMFTKNEGGQQT